MGRGGGGGTNFVTHEVTSVKVATWWSHAAGDRSAGDVIPVTGLGRSDNSMRKRQSSQQTVGLACCWMCIRGGWGGGTSG